MQNKMERLEQLCLIASNYGNEFKSSFYQFFKNDFSWNVEDDKYTLFGCKVYSDRACTIDLASETIFNKPDMHDKLFDFFVEFCVKHPDAWLTCYYSADSKPDNRFAFSSFHYELEKKVVERETRYGTFTVKCDNCGWVKYDDEHREPCFLHTFENDEKYHCPECGNELNMDGWKVKRAKFKINEYKAKY